MVKHRTNYHFTSQVQCAYDLSSSSLFSLCAVCLYSCGVHIIHASDLKGLLLIRTFFCRLQFIGVHLDQNCTTERERVRESECVSESCTLFHM